MYPLLDKITTSNFEKSKLSQIAGIRNLNGLYRLKFRISKSAHEVTIFATLIPQFYQDSCKVRIPQEVFLLNQLHLLIRSILRPFLSCVTFVTFVTNVTDVTLVTAVTNVTFFYSLRNTLKPQALPHIPHTPLPVNPTNSRCL